MRTSQEYPRHTAARAPEVVDAGWGPDDPELIERYDELVDWGEPPPQIVTSALATPR